MYRTGTYISIPVENMGDCGDEGIEMDVCIAFFKTEPRAIDFHLDNGYWKPFTQQMCIDWT
jgi:hypothetical protein